MLSITGAKRTRTLPADAASKLTSSRRHISAVPDRNSLIEALSDLHSLLEEYAPAWYTEEHHRKAESALHPGK